MSSDSETLRTVVQLVAEETGVSPSRIRASTRLLEDLGVDGVDAEELFEALARRFEVDLSGFGFERHFGPEGAWTPFCIHPSSREPVTVGQLAEAAERKVWLPTTMQRDRPATVPADNFINLIWPLVLLFGLMAWDHVAKLFK